MVVFVTVSNICFYKSFSVHVWTFCAWKYSHAMGLHAVQKVRGLGTQTYLRLESEPCLENPAINGIFYIFFQNNVNMLL